MHPAGIVPLLDGIQSALNPQGPEAAVIAEVTWVLFAGGALIFIAVMLTAGWAAFGKRRLWLTRRGVIIGGGVVFPLVTLFALLLYTLLAAAKITRPGEPDLRIEVIGKQWWWDVRYYTPDGALDFITANEIHIPAGTSAEIVLRSADVLHSFWVPALAGKLDVIPGRENRLRLAAERPGMHRGQCAEYCGGPHALMAFLVVAEAPEDFERWRQRQREPAPPPRSAVARKGEQVFLSYCAACHTVRGTPAAGELGPDLSHVGGRLSIAAGVLPNNAGTIAAWIADSQRIKPGNLMPSFGEFRGEELQALAAYVEGLK